MVKVQVDKRDEERHNEATVYGGLTGGATGLSLALAASFAAQKYGVRSYTGLTLPLKAFAITAATTASFIISADAASRKYELAKYAIGSGTLLEREAARDAQLEKDAGIYEESKYGGGKSKEGLSTKDALVEYSKSHRYGIVFGAWGASMVGSFGYIAATPLSFAQKLVQARMVAQALTVAVLIASAGLSSIPTASNGGLNDEEIKRSHREELNIKWKAGSPHALAMEEAKHNATTTKAQV